MPRALFIHNPTAGRPGGRRQLARALRLLRRAGWRGRLERTIAVEGAAPAARKGLAQGFEVLVACGGDGTLGQIAAVLAEAAATSPTSRGSLPTLALLPCGTANVLARDLGLPLAPLAAARALLRARPRALPLGRATFGDGRRRWFLCFASCGFDAHVVASVRPEEKRRWGWAAFLAAALREVPRYGFSPLCGEWRPAGETSARPWRANLAIFALARHYAGPFALYPRREAAQAPPGPLLLLAEGGPLRMLAQLACFLVGAPGRAPGISIHMAESATIEMAGPVQLDGDAADHGPLRLQVIPRGVEILAP